MTETIIIQLQPLPGKFSELADLVRQMVKGLSGYTGCLQAEALLAADRNEIAIYERWDSADSFSDYLIWRSKQGDLQRVYELLSAEPKFSNFVPQAPD